MSGLNPFAANDESAAVVCIHANQPCLHDMDALCNNILQRVIEKKPHDQQTIAYLLHVCPSLTKHTNSMGYTALHMAVEQKQIRTVQQIMHADKDAIHEMHIICRTPYHVAVQENDLDMIRCIVAIDSTVNDQLSKWNESVLHYATDPDVVTYLLKCKPSLIDAIDEAGNTPLHYHLSLGNARLPQYSRTVQILLEKNPRLLYAKNKRGRLALDLASQKYLFHVVETCLRFDPNIQYYDNGCNEYGDTILHLVASDLFTDDTDLLAHLVRTRQSELLIVNALNKTPLSIAILSKNIRALNQFRLHCSLDDTIANYHKHSPKTDIDTWALEQCSMLNNYLVSDLVVLILRYLGYSPKNNQTCRN